MKNIILIVLCSWNLVSQAACQNFILHQQNGDFRLLCGNETFSYKESLAFKGWYFSLPNIHPTSTYNTSPFLADGKDGSTATKLFVLEKTAAKLYIKDKDIFNETKDQELIKRTLKEVIFSRRDELGMQIGDGEPKFYISEAASCPFSKETEAKLLKDKVPHVVFRTALMNKGYSENVKEAESFNCLTNQEFTAWVRDKGSLKQKTCGKSNSFDAQLQLRQVLDAIAIIRGRNISMATSPVDFTEEMTGNW